jgi:hypothetical protein
MEEFSTKRCQEFHDTLAQTTLALWTSVNITYRLHFQTFKIYDNCTRGKQQFPSKRREEPTPWHSITSHKNRLLDYLINHFMVYSSKEFVFTASFIVTERSTCGGSISGHFCKLRVTRVTLKWSSSAVFCCMSAAPTCNKKVSLYCRQKMNVAREAIVLNCQHERTDSWNRCIVRLLFIRSTQIVMLLYPAGMCRDTYILPHVTKIMSTYM